MKESILDVLLYLFEHYFTEDVPPPGELGFLDRERLANGPLLDELTGAGFSEVRLIARTPFLRAFEARR